VSRGTVWTRRRRRVFVSSNQLQVSAAFGADPATWTAEVINPGGAASPLFHFPVDAPAPAVLQVSPSYALAGGSAFPLSVAGDTFHRNSVVQWNGANRVTTPVLTDGGLTIGLQSQIPAADIATIGAAALTVLNPGPGGGVSAPVTFTITDRPPAVEEPPAVWIPSPNFDQRPPGQVIDSIVVHTTERGYNRALTHLTATGSAESVHFLINSDGAITRLVDPVHRAWHATYYDDRSIGIALVGHAADPASWNASNLDALDKLVAWLISRYPSIPAAHPGGDASYTTNCRYVAVGLVGHQQIQPGCDWALATAADPGPVLPVGQFCRRRRSTPGRNAGVP
jgi:hypothetical protein